MKISCYSNMDLYREIILDHYKNPRNYGHLEKPDASIEEGNVTCGDRIVMELKVKIAKLKIIDDIRFSGDGCAISKASASMLTEKVMGESVDSVMELQSKDIVEMLGTELTPSRMKCALLSLEVLQKAVMSLKK